MHSTKLPKTPTANDIEHKVVLVRVDYNVPLEEKAGELVVSEDRRILASLETISFLQKHDCKVVLLAHLGRPQGPADTKLSLKPIAAHLAGLLHTPCAFVPASSGPEVEAAVAQLPAGGVLLLENLRFDPREKQGSTEFAAQLAGLGEVYINEAFSTLHRNHTSTTFVPKLLPHFAGFGLVKELQALDRLLTQPAKPFVCVIGGAKISDKIEAIEQLANIADCILIGGGVANNFFKAEGLEIYRSFTQEASSVTDQEGNYADLAGKLLSAHKHEHMLKDGYIPLPKIIYPIDVIAAPSIETSNSHQTKEISLASGMADQEEHVKLVYADIGPKTTRLYREILSQAETIFWNGPMGVWENSLFASGTHKVACAIADADATSVLGGGDTLAAVDAFGLAGSYSYLSTGGGAGLEYLSDKPLPGLQALLG